MSKQTFVQVLLLLLVVLAVYVFTNRYEMVPGGSRLGVAYRLNKITGTVALCSMYGTKDLEYLEKKKK